MPDTHSSFDGIIGTTFVAAELDLCCLLVVGEDAKEVRGDNSRKRSSKAHKDPHFPRFEDDVDG